MSDKAEQKPCNCGGHGPAGGQSQPTGETLATLVKAAVPQDYQGNFNIRLVGAHSLETGVKAQPRCRPRGHSVGWDRGDLAIDPGLVATLNKADKLMVDWLAKDTANAQSFLADPVIAMRKAGVELSRAEEKTLARANEAAGATRFVGPGVKIGTVSAKAYPNGRIGGLGPNKTDGKTDDFDCGPKRKG
ncbi:MAG TPA: hypothetical protein VN838_13755 [Bradyrhizobium sp.]|nr:hypothetical protein [Bradyrhizobium sp.]